LSGTHSSRTSSLNREAVIDYYADKIRERKDEFSSGDKKLRYMVNIKEKLTDNKSGSMVHGRILPKPNMPV
jgi:hypothetical protein